MSRIRFIEEASSNKLSKSFQDFLVFKQAQGICQETIRQYKVNFKMYCRYCEDSLDINNLKQGALKLFSSLSNKSNVTYNMPYKYLNCFFNWCIKEGILEINPLKALGLKKKKEKPREVNIPYAVINEVLNSFNLKTYAGFRNYVFMIVTLDTGIRPNELLNISIDDIDKKSKTLTVRESVAKTRRKRVLPLSHISFEMLLKLIDLTPIEWGLNRVFYTADGNKLTSSRWTHIMGEHCKRLNLKVTGYDLRHFFAIEFLRKDGNIFALQRLMGHEDISMTKRYLALSQVDIKEQHEKATPLSSVIKRTTRVRKLFK